MPRRVITVFGAMRVNCARERHPGLQAFAARLAANRHHIPVPR